MGSDEVILCDTNIFIEIYRGNEKVIRVIEDLSQNRIAISDVTAAELLYGARNKNELNLIKQDIQSVQTLAITPEISQLAVELVGDYSLSHNLNLPDALIAATAIVYQKSLFTLNEKDFKFVKDLHLFKL